MCNGALRLVVAGREPGQGAEMIQLTDGASLSSARAGPQMRDCHRYSKWRSCLLCTYLFRKKFDRF